MTTSSLYYSDCHCERLIAPPSVGTVAGRQEAKQSLLLNTADAKEKKMFEPRIKLDKDLFERCKKHAAEAGYSSMEEFIAHVLEKELRRGEKKDEDERKEVAKKLRGLGYIG